MLRLKRTKEAAPAKPGDKPSVSTAYATKVSPHGIVEGWSADPAAAVAITEGVAQRVRARYDGKKHVGKLAFEANDASGAKLAEAVTAKDEVGAAEFGKLQEECRRLKAENSGLEIKLAHADSESAAAKNAAEAGGQRTKELEEQLTELAQKSAKQAERIALLETPPPPPATPAVEEAKEASPKPEHETKGRKVR